MFVSATFNAFKVGCGFFPQKVAKPNPPFLGHKNAFHFCGVFTICYYLSLFRPILAKLTVILWFLVMFFFWEVECTIAQNDAREGKHRQNSAKIQQNDAKKCPLFRL